MGSVFRHGNTQDGVSTLAADGIRTGDYTSAMPKRKPPANRIAELRKRLGLSQEQLAERMGTTKGQVSRLEGSSRRLDMYWLYRLARALECHWAEIPAEDNLTSAEIEVIERYRGLNEERRAIFEGMLDAVENKKRA